MDLTLIGTKEADLAIYPSSKRLLKVYRGSSVYPIIRSPMPVIV